MEPPKLKNDCFALPPGVDWTPVDEALAMLRGRLSCVVGAEDTPVPNAAGRILAQSATAVRANPPAANSAVDGYGFAHSSLGEGVQELPLAEGRAAAGMPFDGVVENGKALRILTGAHLPAGIDTVVLEEDVTCDDARIVFHGGLKPGANARDAGEDVDAGGLLLSTGRHLTPQDLALLAATGVAKVSVRKRLRVGVLSTGDELRAVGEVATGAQIYDANRPMLLSILAGWGYEAVDLGHVGDDRAALRARLDDGAQRVDAVLTSGGASAGDEDHVSAILRAEGAIEMWRIAVKPGRPLAMGMWQGVPVFGLPGNPVAAFVCTLIFGRPALSVLAGGDWKDPQGFMVKAAFSKNKKPGRREFLRARLDASGCAEAFKSEGSGRISGLSWADGLVEIGDDAQDISPGDLVRYVPYASFGL